MNIKKTKGTSADNQETFFGYTLSVINGKWKLLIIYYLSKNAPVRYNELQRMVRKSCKEGIKAKVCKTQSSE